MKTRSTCSDVIVDNVFRGNLLKIDGSIIVRRDVHLVKPSVPKWSLGSIYDNYKAESEKGIKHPRTIVWAGVEI